MASVAMQSLISIESNGAATSRRSDDSKRGDKISSPVYDGTWPAEYSADREKYAPAPVPTSEELDAMPIGAGVVYHGPSHFPRAMTVDRSHPVITTGEQTPGELEDSTPSTPSFGQPVDIIQTWWNPHMNKYRHMAACLSCFCNGMNDSAPGALLPYLEKYYNIDYTAVSMIFIGNAVGFILAAFFVHALEKKLGRARLVMFCDLITILGYVTTAVAPPFPAFVVAYFICGYGMATALALNNVFCANLANSSTMLGAFHGCYGVGGVIAPIIATSLVTKGILFSRFYLILLGVRVISFFFGGWAFWDFERDIRSPDTLLTALERTTSRQADGEVDSEPSKSRLLKDALKARTTLVGAFFIFAYQGAEVSISGWIISFLINYRNSNPAHVGYVTAGFWAGITLGRFCMPPLAHRLGEKPFTYGLIIGALAFQLLVWFVPNVIGDSVAVAIVGLLLGPIYPCATTIFTRVLPRSMQNTSLAFISSAGSSGGAIAPFATGIISQKAGTWVLHPICIALFATMEICWFALPKTTKRRD